ncbi:hypothetical protein SCHPADRAFT_943549 [Schizopora paradoxa]|uniref:Yeast cell wall synthesis Kre9/Knh1-like N-terminal domain-containing protein n=1 Tax=Schizopora paradoxa TaxID=27342 RepID=A0A0H2RXR8_9AGAM|nr:hypothetical protein SCHPADRAFT_943549 [Schizopora paradoxa]
MFKTILFTSFSVMSALAIPTPNAPTPGTIFKTGGDCTIGWDADTTGKWTTMNIELMAGPNLAMEHLTTVATVDGTNANNNTFTYPCPGVTPNSAIFFYQFSSPAEPTNITWTGRFAIGDAEGNTTPPPNATQPNSNDAIPWGNAQLLDPSSATPAPSYLGSSTVVVSTSSNTNSSTVVVTSATSAASGIITSAVGLPTSGSSSDSDSASPASSSPSVDASNSNSTTSANGASSLEVSKRGVPALVALAGTALAFLTVF